MWRAVFYIDESKVGSFTRKIITVCQYLDTSLILLKQLRKNDEWFLFYINHQLYFAKFSFGVGHIMLNNSKYKNCSVICELIHHVTSISPFHHLHDHSRPRVHRFPMESTSFLSLKKKIWAYPPRNQEFLYDSLHFSVN